MPSANGSWTNALSLDWNANTFVRVLRENGYRTGLIGKSHLQDSIDRRPSKDGSNMLDLSSLGLIRRQPQGDGRAQMGPYTEVGQDWDRFEQHWLHQQGLVDMPPDYYGFDTVELALNHDDRPAGHHYYWVKEQGGQPDTMGGRERAKAVFEPWSQVWKSSCPVEFYSTNFVTERSLAFLDEALSSEQPFFLTASFPDPHHPFALPDPYYSMFEREAIPLPETFFDTHQGGLPHLERLASQRGRDVRGPFTFSASPEQFREAAAVELGAIALLDQAIGRLLDELEQRGLADNTVVIFCSDHGDLGGDHGLMLKFAAHYQGVLRVPLLISGPGIRPGRSDSLASLLDLGQTVLALSGAKPYIGMQGHSLAPILDEPSTAVRDTVMVEEDYQADFIGHGQDLAVRTLVTQEARLTIYLGLEQGELYDLSSDPLETQNLFMQPGAQSLKTDMMALLLQAMLGHRDFSRYPL
jgi:arylsulfatase A-like enzyme